MPAEAEETKGGEDEGSRLNQNPARSGGCQAITLSVQSIPYEELTTTSVILDLPEFYILARAFVSPVEEDICPHYRKIYLSTSLTLPKPNLL